MYSCRLVVVPELGSVEESEARVIDDAALQVRVVVVRFEHEKLGAAGPIHRIASLGWERETLYGQEGVTGWEGKRKRTNRHMNFNWFSLEG